MAAKPLKPFYKSAHKGRETCAHPGACSEVAKVEVDQGGFLLGFCEAHAERPEIVEVEETDDEETNLEVEPPVEGEIFITDRIGGSDD